MKDKSVGKKREKTLRTLTKVQVKNNKCQSQMVTVMMERRKILRRNQTDLEDMGEGRQSSHRDSLNSKQPWANPSTMCRSMEV